MANVTSYEIKEALARKHGDREFFMTEVKNGPSGVQPGALLQFDGVAIYKSWTRPCIRGYEVKVSRSDFLRDAKYPCYLPYFHEFYFVTPKGMVKREEVEENIGLIWYDPETGNLTTKKKAVWRDIELDAAFLLYIIMYRVDSDRAPFTLHKEEAFSAWLKGKESNRQLAYTVKSKLLKDNAALEEEVRRLKVYEDAQEKLNALKTVMAKHGVKSYWHPEEALDEALSTAYPKELDDIRQEASRVVASIDKLKFRYEKEEAQNGT